MVFKRLKELDDVWVVHHLHDGLCSEVSNPKNTAVGIKIHACPVDQ